jgi:hypothetical protein
MSTFDPNSDPDDIEFDFQPITDVWRRYRRPLRLVTAVAVLAVAGIHLWHYAALPPVRRSMQIVRFALDAGQLRDGHSFKTAELVAPGVIERAYASLGPVPVVPLADLERQISIPTVNAAAGEYALVLESAGRGGLPDGSVFRLLQAVMGVWQRDRIDERLRRQQPDRWVFNEASSGEASVVAVDQLRSRLGDP